MNEPVNQHTGNGRPAQDLQSSQTTLRSIAGLGGYFPPQQIDATEVAAVDSQQEVSELSELDVQLPRSIDDDKA
jgi:hypothetical protein